VADARGLERSRELLVKQRTQLMDSVRSQCAEFGIVAAQGRRGFAELTALLAAEDERLPAALVPVLRLLLDQIDYLAAAIARLEEQIVATAKADPTMRRLATIPGVGAIVAHAIVAAAGDGRQFRSPRDFAAWVGLTPQEQSSAGKRRTKGISRQGDGRLRKLFALGASTIMRNARATPWQRGILARRPVKVAVLAQAAQSARIAWAMLISGQAYRRPAPATAVGMSPASARLGDSRNVGRPTDGAQAA
jgi:transposase